LLRQYHHLHLRVRRFVGLVGRAGASLRRPPFVPVDYRERPGVMAISPPAIAATAPSTNIHMERSVGDPVNVSDTSDAKESEAFIPQKSNMTPPTISAIPTALRAFIVAPP